MLKADKQDGRTVASRVVFAKLREEPDSYPAPVSFAIDGDTLSLQSGDSPADDRPIEDRIEDLLRSGPKTKSALANGVRRSRKCVEEALTNLFAARRITSTYVTINKREEKAFARREAGA
jgi:hypothetical protein